MKERPILFSGPMVRAILEGRKTQTRRVVTPSTSTLGIPWPASLEDAVPQSDRSKLMVPGHDETWHRLRFRAESGDRLWVREAWCETDWQRDGQMVPGYRADYPEGTIFPAPWNPRWRPSIHMPRWACRIVLEVVSVRVERVQDISEADALAEGAEPLRMKHGYAHRPGFIALWDSINDARGCGWDANPWVWVIEFKAVTP